MAVTESNFIKTEIRLNFGIFQKNRDYLQFILGDMWRVFSDHITNVTCEHTEDSVYNRLLMKEISNSWLRALNA